MSPKKTNPFWFIVAVGLGFCIYGAYNWVQVEEPTAEELQRSVDINYQADIARMRASSEDGQLNLNNDWEQKHRKAIRDELTGAVQHEKDLARSWFVVGIALLIFSLGRILAAPLFADKK